MDIESIEDAKALLYGHSLESFVAERDALVKTIRAAGDRALANEIKSLRKPSAIAAEVNSLVRANSDGIELILQAASLLRSAQAGALDGSTIDASELQQQYRAAIQALAQSAPRRRAEVSAALEAATIDEASNEALRAGYLVLVPTPVSIFGSVPSDSDEARPEAPDSQAATEEAAIESPVDELEQRRVIRAEKKAAAEKTAAAKAAATKTADKKKAAAEAERERKAADKKKAAAEAERKAAEKKAAAEAERERKAAEKKRKEERKRLQKLHREALRSHLAALDDEEAASQAVEDGDEQLADLVIQIESAEQALVDLRTEHEQTVAAREQNELAKAEAHQRAEAAETTVDELAAKLDALD